MPELAALSTLAKFENMPSDMHTVASQPDGGTKVSQTTRCGCQPILEGKVIVGDAGYESGGRFCFRPRLTNVSEL
jgi:hypothetical protein